MVSSKHETQKTNWLNFILFLKQGSGSGSEAVPNYDTYLAGKRASIIAKRENKNGRYRLGESKRVSSGSAMLNNNINDSQASPSRSTPTNGMQQSQYGDRVGHHQSQIPRPSSSAPSLLLDPQSGQIIDEQTGRAYWLKPANNVAPY